MWYVFVFVWNGCSFLLLVQCTKCTCKLFSMSNVENAKTNWRNFAEILSGAARARRCARGSSVCCQILQSVSRLISHCLDAVFAFSSPMPNNLNVLPLITCDFQTSKTSFSIHRSATFFDESPVALFSHQCRWCNIVHYSRMALMYTSLLLN